MEFKAEQKYIRISPRKVRPVVDVIKKLTPKRALEVLPFVKKRGTEFVIKVLKSAINNANQKGVDIDKLSFKEIQIGEGPRLKRGIAVSRGRWHSIKKRMSHIRIVLTMRNVDQTTPLSGQMSNAKSTKKTEIKSKIIKKTTKTKKGVQK